MCALNGVVYAFNDALCHTHRCSVNVQRCTLSLLSVQCNRSTVHFVSPNDALRALNDALRALNDVLCHTSRCSLSQLSSLFDALTGSLTRSKLFNVSSLDSLNNEYITLGFRKNSSCLIPFLSSVLMLISKQVYNHQIEKADKYPP